MASTAFLTGLCFVVLAYATRFCESASGLPHSSCKYFPPNFECTESNLEIPTKFDVSKIPDDVRSIRLDCPDSHHMGVYCNTLKRSAQPFPNRPQLRTVHFYGFTIENGGPFLTVALLGNVKQQIEYLAIRYSKFTKLDAESFRGFSSLKTLIADGNDLVDIAPDTFQFLSARPSVLSSIDFGGNRIVSFDWATLQPLADSLKEVVLSQQRPGLQTLSRSSSKFSLKKLSTLGLNQNKLSTLPKAVLETINDYSVYYGPFSMVGNPFCPSDASCGCCEMKDFFAWVREFKQKARGDLRLMLNYDCGSGDAAKQYSLSVEPTGYVLATGKPNDINLEMAEFNPNPSFNPNTGRDRC